jgi:hypothetical protein
VASVAFGRCERCDDVTCLLVVTRTKFVIVTFFYTVSLSSTTSVTYKAGGRVVIEFPNVMSSLNLGARSTGEELMLTVGACFVGLDLVHHMAYYPVRLSVVEDLILASRLNGGHAGVFSSLNRLDCGMRVLSSWEKRMF